ncbi:sensor histidine kinase [Actinomadura sp. HBU206391]|uniref:sensor histidine kinase n=1 Tax=Actinomadura sp. HBU206391 TaxID=2731692 RepID=UPI00164F1058|nr:histidine kinase [Actinomadura sp. HBU206391]MBC6458289.1 sensor domain-containing protein [Actinomadura sp. HBU206391]
MQLRRVITVESWWSIGYHLSGLAIAPLYWLPPLGALIGLVCLPLLLLGLPILLLAMRGASRVTILADRRLSRELGVPAAPAGPRPALHAMMTGRPGWRALGLALLVAAWDTGTGALVLSGLALGVTLTALPILVPALGADSATFAGVPLNPLTIALGAVLGLTVIVAELATARPLLLFGANLMARTRDEAEAQRLRQRIATLETTRTRVVDAAEAERRRIERDLHDGAQQRLLAVSIAISRAHRQLSRDPEKAEELLNEAQGDARAAIEELRGIARSAHPPVLTERGLQPAVTTMARRFAVPVRLDVRLADRPARRSEAVAYYVVAELLTNIAKHAGASAVSVRLWREDDRLRICVTDDGRGGAEEKEGGGLAGLRARLDAVDGGISITSPSGGATMVEAELPWNA